MELMQVLERSENGWWFVAIGGSEGWAPASYIQEVSKAGGTSTQEDDTMTTDSAPSRPLPPSPPAVCRIF